MSGRRTEIFDRKQACLLSLSRDLLLEFYPALKVACEVECLNLYGRENRCGDFVFGLGLVGGALLAHRFTFVVLVPPDSSQSGRCSG